MLWAVRGAYPYNLKKVWKAIIFLCVSSLCYGQVRGPQDIVLIVDKGVLTDENKAFVRDSFLRSRVKLGDTFHLIAFTDAASLLFSRRIMGNSDLEAAANAIPSAVGETASNTSAALTFAADYLSALNNTRQKQAFLITDAPNAGDLTAAARSRFSAVNASLEFSRPPERARQPSRNIPLDSGGVSLSAPSVSTTPPVQAIPPPISTTPPVQILPSESGAVPPPSPLSAPPAEQSDAARVPTGGETPLSPPPVSETPPAVTVTPQLPEEDGAADSPPGANRPPVRVITPEAPDSDTERVRMKSSFRLPSLPRLPQGVINALLVLSCAAAFLAILGIRKAENAPSSAFAAITSGESAKIVLLSLFVEDQNANIGRRNVHSVSMGHSLTLGGGNSDFLIFLVPLPQNIAEIRFDGHTCAFVPRKRRFFPEITTKMLPDCVGKTISIVSERNYRLSIRIMRHEEPYPKLAAFCRSIKLPAQLGRI